MLFANIREASCATHPALVAHLSHFSPRFVRIGQRLFREANLAVLWTCSELHSYRTAVWPFIGPGLLPHPPDWMSHTTGQLVEATSSHQGDHLPDETSQGGSRCVQS